MAVFCLSVVMTACASDTAQKGSTITTNTTTKTATTPAKAETGTMTDSLADKRHAIRTPKNNLVTLETNFGSMTVELYRDLAPNHADSFLARTLDGFYDSTIFHRIMPNFMIQGGDPLGNGTGGAGYNLNAEFSQEPHLEGTLSAARSSDPNSASSQFYICLTSTPFLDGKYTVFGHLIKGYDVLHKIEKVETVVGNGGEKSKPVEKVMIIRAYASDAEGEPVKK